MDRRLPLKTAGRPVSERKRAMRPITVCGDGLERAEGGLRRWLL